MEWKIRNSPFNFSDGIANNHPHYGIGNGLWVKKFLHNEHNNKSARSRSEIVEYDSYVTQPIYGIEGKPKMLEALSWNVEWLVYVKFILLLFIMKM